MASTGLAYVFIFIAMLLFLILSARIFAKYSKLSVHSRFDLYPVPKEGNGRGDYGGSYFEEDDWWTKERKINRLAEDIDIGKEMFFIRKMFINQRGAWIWSFLFHGGIYFMLLWSILLIPAAFVTAPGFLAFTTVVGYIGFICATIGAVVLFFRRVFVEDVRVYTTPEEYFNLLLIIVNLCMGAYIWTNVANVFVIAHNVLTFNFVAAPAIIVVHFFILGFMMIYIPLSKMGHYAGKFFSFRSVMWDNNPNLPGNKVDQNVKASNAAGAKVKWGAPHTQPQPKQTEE